MISNNILAFSSLLLYVYIYQCSSYPVEKNGNKDEESIKRKKELNIFTVPIKRNNGVASKTENQNMETILRADRGTETRSNSQETTYELGLSFTKDEIDKQFVGEDSDLEWLLETMSCNGNKATGIHPNLKSSAKAMQLERKYYEHQQNSSTSNKRNFIPEVKKRWENGIVPYYVKIESYDKKYRDKLERLLTETEMDYRQKTCIRLKRITNRDMETGKYPTYVIVSSEDGCWSFVGKQNKPQTISLKQGGCFEISTFLHEFGHAIGMQHEQSRSDRDNHITIDWSNVNEDQITQYEKEDTLDSYPYDYHSIMQYDLNSFAHKEWMHTIMFKDPDLEFLAEHSKRLTFYDAMDININYHCSDGCEFDGPCLYGGYVGASCECNCIEGLTGVNCEKIASVDCGGIIDLTPGEDITITSPNYPNNYIEGKICYWLLKAEHPKQRVMIEVKDFDVAHNEELCRCHNWLEVRYNLPGQPGPKYCGSKFDKNKISTTEYGNSHLMMLIFDSATVTGVDTTRGFSLKARAIRLEGEGCTMEPPPNVPNSSNDFKDVGSSFGTVVRYTCDDDYQMEGKNGVTCEADGTWSKKRFQCVKKAPLFECDFSHGKCGITNPNAKYKWTIFIVEGVNDPLFTVTPTKSLKWRSVWFGIPVQLKADVTYCLSFYFRRYSGKTPCAEFSVGDSDQRYWPWEYADCKKTGWEKFKGNYGPYNKDHRMEFFMYLDRPDGYFNVDIDEIVLKEGSC